jgi:hypothetical protein
MGVHLGELSKSRVPAVENWAISTLQVVGSRLRFSCGGKLLRVVDSRNQQSEEIRGVRSKSGRTLLRPFLRR